MIQQWPLHLTECWLKTSNGLMDLQPFHSSSLEYLNINRVLEQMQPQERSTGNRGRVLYTVDVELLSNCKVKCFFVIHAAERIQRDHFGTVQPLSNGTPPALWKPPRDQDIVSTATSTNCWQGIKVSFSHFVCTKSGLMPEKFICAAFHRLLVKEY